MGNLEALNFNLDIPNYINYGSVGLVMGHEFGHNFDNAQKLLSMHNKTRDSWNSTTEKQFLNRSQCIINQYSDYTVNWANKKVSLKNC